MYVGFGTNIATPGQGNIIRSCFAEESTIFFGTLLNPRLVIALLSFGLAGVLAGCMSNEPDGPTSDFTLTDPNVEGHLHEGDSTVVAKPQENPDRSFREERWTLAWRHELEQHSTMLQITTSADESRLYILDMAAPHVTMLDARDGSYMDQFGRSGEGPGEFVQPERITIAHDGHLLIPDSRRRVIHVFAEDGRFVQAIPVGNVGPVDVVAADSGFFWIHAGTPAAIATLYDGEGDRLRDAGVFSREIPAGMGKNGYLLRHPNRPSMFYVGRFGGRLSKFTLEGDLRFHRQTIDPNDYPAPVALSGGESFTMDQSNVHALRALAGVTDEGVYVGIIQTVEEPSSGLRFLVDRYDPETGDYLYSYDSPNPDCTIVWMTDAHVYTHCPLDSSIERWRRAPDQP